MTAHAFDPELRDVALAQHLTAAHHYSSSNELEDFTATHRRLHGVPSASAEYLRAQLAKAWQEGFDAAWLNRQQPGWVANPYAPEPVSTTQPPVELATGLLVRHAGGEYELRTMDEHWSGGIYAVFGLVGKPVETGPANPELWV